MKEHYYLHIKIRANYIKTLNIWQSNSDAVFKYTNVINSLLFPNYTILPIFFFFIRIFHLFLHQSSCLFLYLDLLKRNNFILFKLRSEVRDREGEKDR